MRVAGKLPAYSETGCRSRCEYCDDWVVCPALKCCQRMPAAYVSWIGLTNLIQTCRLLKPRRRLFCSLIMQQWLAQTAKLLIRECGAG